MRKNERESDKVRRMKVKREQRKTHCVNANKEFSKSQSLT